MASIRDGLVRRTIRKFRTEWKVPFANLKRQFISPEIIIGVTGSAGKSTSARILAEITREKYVTHTTRGMNTVKTIQGLYLKKVWNTQVWVQEVSGHSSTEMDAVLRFLRPKIGIVTTVGFDHISNFGSIQDIKENKQKLIEQLPEDGCAILNFDDEMVAEMATSTAAQVMSFGCKSEADVRLISIEYNAISEMQLTVAIDGNEHQFPTRFIGVRWCTSILAAIAAAHYLKFELESIKSALATVEPELYKDSVHHANGVTYVLDCFKAAEWTVSSSLEIVEKIEAKRKFVILGTISDYIGSSRPKYTKAVRSAFEVADFVITYGNHAHRARRIADEYPRRFLRFECFEELQAYLKSTLTEGDLVYIKASGKDRLGRIWHDIEHPIACYTDDCKRLNHCNSCKYLYKINEINSSIQ